jgi:hypothetical protein
MFAKFHITNLKPGVKGAIVWKGAKVSYYYYGKWEETWKTSLGGGGELTLSSIIVES